VWHCIGWIPKVRSKTYSNQIQLLHVLPKVVPQILQVEHFTIGSQPWWPNPPLSNAIFPWKWTIQRAGGSPHDYAKPMVPWWLGDGDGTTTFQVLQPLALSLLSSHLVSTADPLFLIKKIHQSTYHHFCCLMLFDVVWCFKSSTLVETSLLRANSDIFSLKIA
jgi:hypothetical protein